MTFLSFLSPNFKDWPRFIFVFLKTGLQTNGLAMGSSAAKPQTKQKTCFFAQGRADLRAADRSADERSEAEAPKKNKKKAADKNQQL